MQSIVGAIDQIVEADIAARLSFELITQPVERSVYLGSDVLSTIRILLDQSVGCLVQNTGFLFYDDNIAGLVDDYEIRLSKSRSIGSVARPMNGMEYGVGRRQTSAKRPQRPKLRGLSQRQRELGNIGRQQTRHVRMIADPRPPPGTICNL